jgi:hypothetical protein
VAAISISSRAQRGSCMPQAFCWSPWPSRY